MPSFCGVINCGARSGRDNERWFRVPMISRLPNKVALTTKRQKAWIDALKRTGLNPATYNNLRVCSKHFLSGEPAALNDTDNPDWTPTQNLGYETDKLPSTSALKRFEQKRKTTSSYSATQVNASPRAKKYASDSSSLTGHIVQPKSSISSNVMTNMTDSVTPDRASSLSSTKTTFSDKPAISNEIDSLSGRSLNQKLVCIKRNVPKTLSSVQQSKSVVTSSSSSGANVKRQRINVPTESTSSSSIPAINKLPVKLPVANKLPVKNRFDLNALSDTTINLLCTVQLEDKNVKPSDNSIQSTMELSTNDCSIELSLSSVSQSSQTDLNSSNFDLFKINGQYLQTENERLQNIISAKEISLAAFENNDKKTCFFTGISSFVLMKTIFQKIEPNLPVCKKLTKFQIFYLTLVRMRLDLSFTHLSYMFDVSRDIISSYWHQGLEILYSRLRGLIKMPSRSALKYTMPVAFQLAFGDKIPIIVDSFEICIEKSSNPATANQTWSNCKHGHTVKYLIGVSPQSVIVYISDAYGGGSSDKFIVEDSGFLNNIEEGDIVMADRDFLTADYSKTKGAKLQTPAFTKGRDQLHPMEIDDTRKIGNVRLLVQRVIGQIKLKYKIFQNHQFPTQLLCETNKYNVSVIDQMVTVACALINLCNPVHSKQMASVFSK